MRRIQLFLFSAALLLSLFGMTAFTGLSVASAHTHVANARATSAHVTRRSHPQVTCSGEGCDGQNPATEGCGADAYTVQTAVFSNSYVELRYSPACGTNWGRVFSKVGPTLLVVRIQRQSDGLTYTFSGGNFNFAFSAMVYAPKVAARACGGVNAISGCTAY